jgi:hypothetical protein
MFFNKATAQIRTNVMACVFNVGLLTEVSLHPEAPVTGQLDQFSLIPEQMLSWYPNSTLHYLFEYKLYCDRRSVSQLALVSGPL